METPAPKVWPHYYTATIRGERRFALAHSPRRAARLLAAHFWPAPPPPGWTVAIEPIGPGFGRWAVAWTDGRTRRRIGRFDLIEGE
jgi:hypothetical protein